MGNFFNDIGKAVTRMLTPSQRQIDAISQLTPVLSPIFGAAAGNQAVTQAWLAMYNPASANAYAQAAGTGIYSTEQQVALLQAGGMPGGMAGMPGMGGLVDASGAGALVGAGSKKKKSDDETLLIVAGGVAVLAVVYVVMSSRR